MFCAAALLAAFILCLDFMIVLVLLLLLCLDKWLPPYTHTHICPHRDVTFQWQWFMAGLWLWISVGLSSTAWWLARLSVRPVVLLGVLNAPGYVWHSKTLGALVYQSVSVWVWVSLLTLASQEISYFSVPLATRLPRSYFSNVRNSPREAATYYSLSLSLPHPIPSLTLM